MNQLSLLLAPVSEPPQVVRGLLDFARETQYTFEIADINASVRQALDLFSYQLTANNTEIVTNLAQDLPEIEASLEHLQSVWLNLLINARQAMPSGGRVLLKLSHDKKNNTVDLVVRDTGSGIEPAKLRSIFDPFFSTKSGPDETGKGGTGVGLSACKDIIESHR